MAVLHVRNIPNQLYADVQRIAKAHGRSLTEQVILLFQQISEDEQRRNTHQQIIEELAQRRELGQAFKPPSDMSVTQILDQVREEAA